MKKNTLNANSMRLTNQKNIIDMLRIAPRSRAELARQTGLTRAAISVLIDSLISDTVVVEDELISGKVGRSSMNMKLNPFKYCTLAFDIARDSYRIGLTDFAGKILQVKTCQYKESYYAKDVILELIHQGKMMIENEKCRGSLLGIGITAPGPLDAHNGIILSPPNFITWKNIEIKKKISSAFQCPVYLENNAKALALAEQYFGRGSQFGSYLELVVDSGIGGGIIIDGKPYMGKYGFGGDIGHITVDINGESCNCGNKGCAELYASMPNIVAYAVKLDHSLTSWKEIVDQKEKGNDIAEGIVEREADFLAAILTTAVNLLDVEAIVAAGEILYKGSSLLKEIEMKMNQHFMGREVRNVPVYESQLPQQSNILAAANLVLEQYVHEIQ